MTITPEQILETIRNAIEPLDYVNAMWLGGSHAFGAEDEYSDVDVQIDVADGRQEDAFEIVEAALAALSPIELKLRLPEPTWHGHSQAFYRLENTEEWHMVDFVVQQRNTEADRLTDRERHGEPVVVFDKLGVIKSTALDKAAHREEIKQRLEAMRFRFEMFSHMAAKGVERGLEIDAFWHYTSFVLTPLVYILRLRYCPAMHDYGPRYLKRDLPPGVYKRLERLTYVRDVAELREKTVQAVDWGREEFAAIDVDQLKL